MLKPKIITYAKPELFSKFYKVKFYNRKSYGPPANIPLVGPMSPDGKSLVPKKQTYPF